MFLQNNGKPPTRLRQLKEYKFLLLNYRIFLKFFVSVLSCFLEQLVWEKYDIMHSCFHGSDTLVCTISLHTSNTVSQQESK
jgi:hypothetical protein